MKLFVHFCAFGFSNCYILGTDGSDSHGSDSPGPLPKGPEKPQESASKEAVKEAIIIDPGSMDEQIITIIEENKYALRGVLFTHGHTGHVHGITTLKRIYDTEIYCISPAIQEYKTIPVRDGEILHIGSFRIEVIAVPGHSADSAVFKAGRLLFTGDALSAGLVGSTASVYAAANQMTALRSKILSLPGYHVIFPGHGPPTSLEAEQRFNSGINSYEDNKSRRSRYRLELD